MCNLENMKLPTFATIKQVQRMGILSEYRARLMLKSGELPGHYCGSRYYIHVEQLLKQMGAE